MSTIVSALLVGIPAILAASWIAWRPGKEHPDSPIRIRGIFRTLNLAGRLSETVLRRPLLRLNPENFAHSFTAIKKAEHELYGSPDTPSELNGLRALFRGLESPGALPSSLGKLLFKRTLRRSLRHRHQIINYVREHPEVLELPIVQPLIITGLPRTGTTFLQRLLATDPRARAPHIWLMAIDPSPRPPTEDEIANQSDPRLKALQNSWKNTLVSPNKEQLRSMSHASQLTEVDEESDLMAECMWQNAGMSGFVGQDESYMRWILDDNEDKSYIYKYLKVWLQIQTSVYAPKSHWLLKTPSHSLFLPACTKEFPDANLLFIHRNPRSVVPSACRISIFTYILRMDFRKYDPKQHGRRTLQALKAGVDEVLRFHHSNSEASRRALHILYEDLVADPIGTAERIYAHFGYQVTEEFRANMREYLAKNPQHKHGKPSYSLEEFGLNETMIEETFEEYIETFRRQPVAEAPVL